jgi:hypothetical protein
VNELTEWDSFYVIIGSAAGALIGLQFVVLTLIAERPPLRAAEAGAAFGTPTIVHFSAVLLVSALLRAPWHAYTSVQLLCAIAGVCGSAYVMLTARRMRVQPTYKPQFEDWAFHVLLPGTAYAMLAGAALMVPSHFRQSLFTIAAASLLLLFAAIHNAWDAVAYHVLVNRGHENGPD